MPRLFLIILTLLFTLAARGAITRTPPPMLYEQYKDLPLEQLNQRGMEYFVAQKNDSAVMLLTLVVQRDTIGLDKETRKLMAKARNVLGIINFNHANYQAAYTHFLKSIQLDDVPDAAGYLSLASVFLHYGDKARAFEYLKAYTSYAASHGHYNEAGLGVANILSTNFVRAGVSPDSISKVVNQFLHLPPEAKKAKSYPLAHALAKGWVESHNNRHLEAIAEMQTALHDLDTLLMPRTRHALYLFIADQYINAGDMDSAMSYIRNAETLAIDNDYKDLLAKTYSDASLAHATFGNKEMSDYYRQRMLEINDTLFNPRELGKLHDLNMFHEIDKFERRIEIMAVRDRMRMTVLWTVGIALCVVIVLLVILFRQNRDLRKKNRTLFERNLSEMEAEKYIAKPETVDTDPPCEEEMAEEDEAARKYNGSNISDETRDRVRKCIMEVFEDENIFCQEGFSLNDLARICDSNSRYVSQVINEDMSTTFTQLLNSERVKVARKRFMDVENYGHLTIETIIGGLGCKSRSTFSKTFKRMTGLSPSEFQRMARNMADSNSPKEEV